MEKLGMNIMNIEKLNNILGKPIEMSSIILSYDNNKLVLSLNFDCDNGIYTIDFYNVSSLRINEISSPMQVQGLDIIDNKEKGWDSSVRYSVVDYEDDIMSFYCEDFNIK